MCGIMCKTIPKIYGCIRVAPKTDKKLVPVLFKNKTGTSFSET